MVGRKKEESPVDSVANLLEQINNDKSIESVFFSLGDGPIEDISRGSSGIFSLDHALGGGYPYGRIVEAFGVPSGGKSTICLHAIAAAHKRGNIGCVIDAEYSFSMSYAEKIGVIPSQTIVTQPDYGEQGLESTIQLVKKLNPGDVVVVDSVAALTPKAELEGTVESNHIGLQARMMSQALRTLTGEVSKSGVIMMFVNQTRTKIGVAFGDPTTTPGGNALKFYASIRLNVKNMGKIKKKEEAIGHRLQIEVVKNKTAPPFRKANTRMTYGRGVPRSYDLLAQAQDLKIVEKKGKLSFGGNELKVGFDNSADFLEENPEILEILEQHVLQKLGYKPYER